MAHVTEAACLLQSGALYGRRVGLRPESGDEVFAGLKPGAFSLYFGDAPIYHFDLEGRWQRAFVEGVHYLKGLDAAVHAVDRVREGPNLVLHRRTVPFGEATDLDDRIRAAALELMEGVDSGRLGRLDPPPAARPLGLPDLRAILDRVAGWDAAAWFAHRERYASTYGPLPFLPPDCQHPVVLQATLGHARGLAFAGAGAAEHYVRTPEEFAAHAAEVARLLGRRVEQCRSVFLAGSDALTLPPADVSAYLAAASAAFPVDPGAARPRAADFDPAAHRLDGVHAFLDRLEGPLPSRADWSAFRERNLVRVHLGVESGDPSVRAAYGRAWPDEALRDLVADLKAAGLGVSVVTLVGLDSEGHSDATADLVNALPLGPGDLVCLLDADELAGPEPARGPALVASEAEKSKRRLLLKSLLAAVRSDRGAKVTTYSLEKQAGA